jgi:hypothetical protein
MDVFDMHNIVESGREASKTANEPLPSNKEKFTENYDYGPELKGKEISLKQVIVELVLLGILFVATLFYVYWLWTKK